MVRCSSASASLYGERSLSAPVSAKVRSALCCRYSAASRRSELLRAGSTWLSTRSTSTRLPAAVSVAAIAMEARRAAMIAHRTTIRCRSDHVMRAYSRG
jgi:hypothetical protein